MLTEEEMICLLKADLSQHRFSHTLGVRDTAVELARIHLGDEHICRTAGILHDCAKSLTENQMVDLINRFGIALYPGEIDNPELLHAPAGAALAQEKYKVSDKKIINAIRNHTLGPKGMSLEEAIVFVADFIEPGRRNFDGLDHVRQLAKEDIRAAVDDCKRLTREYCIINGRVPLDF